MPLNDDRTAMLISNADGVVLHADAVARRRFGTCAGRTCAQVLNATTVGGESICEAGCVQNVLGGATRSRVLGTMINGEEATLRCQAVEGLVVVSTTPVAAERVLREVLTAREIEVLRLVAAGETGKAIAARLGIGTETVRTHMDHARAKLGAATRPAAVARAMQLGLRLD